MIHIRRMLTGLFMVGLIVVFLLGVFGIVYLICTHFLMFLIGAGIVTAYCMGMEME